MDFVFNKSDTKSQILIRASSDYTINIGEHIIADELYKIGIKYDSLFIITDSNLEKYHQNLINEIRSLPHCTGKFVLNPGENEKNWQNLDAIITNMLQSNLNRNSAVIAIGGGVVCDISGLAAALFMRGIDCHMVPTTLLAMVDASIGGKTGINHDLGKNLIGTITQPAGVTIDFAFLETLPQREFLAGMAEVIKYGYIFDRGFLAYIDENWTAIISLNKGILETITWYCCEAKSRIVMADEFEGNIRMLLNFGHTFGHALETFFGYDKMLHGEAVNIGMIMANTFSESLGLIEKGFSAPWHRLHHRLGINSDLVKEWDAERLTELMEYDKKRGKDHLKLILPGTGSLTVYNKVKKKALIRLWAMMKTKLSSADQTN